jgi:hypothetical protein
MKSPYPNGTINGMPIPAKNNASVAVLGPLGHGMLRRIVVNRAVHLTRERRISFLAALLIENARHLGGLPTAIPLTGSPLADWFPTAKDLADIIEDLKLQNPVAMQGIFDGENGEKIVSADVIHGLANKLRGIFKKLKAPAGLLKRGPSGSGYGLNTRPTKLVTNLLVGLRYSPRPRR